MNFQKSIQTKQKMSLIVKKLSPNAVIPTRGSDYAAGLDLYSPISGTILPMQRLLVPLEICVTLPKNTYGHILPRSGLALKSGIHVGAGVVDEDYTGNVGVLLFNLSDQPYTFFEGDRIAQFVIKKYERVDVVVSESLEKSKRGDGGFGSSGK